MVLVLGLITYFCFGKRHETKARMLCNTIHINLDGEFE